jgi:chemotaxis protein histidine kinase CheA
MTVTTCAAFSNLDEEIIKDFSECLRENIDAIESCINLLDTESDPELIHRLFRDMHSFKGNCRMVELDPVAEPIHALEEIVSEMRQGTRQYESIYGDFFMSIILRIETMIKSFSSTGEVFGEPQVLMLKVINNVLACEPGQDNQAVNEALNSLANASKLAREALQTQNEDATIHDAPQTQTPLNDLAFFKTLSLQLDELGIYKTGRTEALLDLCLRTNQELDEPVSPDQLTAAVYMHDIGMAFVPCSILEKASKLNQEELKVIENHINAGTQMLKKIPGWEVASEIVNQHHERYNGSGYPQGLSADNIHPGAMILALADTFYAVTHERADRSFKKSLFSATSMINGETGRLFKPCFVEAFNNTIRNRYLKR